MKRNLHLLLIIIVTALLFCGSVNAQTEGQVPERPKYLVWVSPLNTPTLTKGYLTHLQDSLLITSNAWRHAGTSIYYKDIDVLRFRKNSSITNGFLLGAVAGAATGGIVGILKGGEVSRRCSFICLGGKGVREIPNNYGILFAVPGGVIGALIGAHKITIPINGKTKNQKQEIIKRLKF